MLSVQIATLALAWGLLPPDQHAAMLALIGIGPERVPAVLGLLFLLGRLIDQPKTRDTEDDKS
jgi:hypothetical protein